ncbi:hypothetical protein GUITHDRAFT_148875 [Guillardia theta CCMP2712]|uniref:Uncharacterized protein n=1 Tax=Guillardia theta (strain CCMP2712) TaxID=905079 RepID=L1I7J5_GUITC|nr:hypothetical protein GUITHDRAFT_148875 [Guillardia theta CCMP2712]EKX32062.1 hypothetical protein GUITHDRAFT_148875 [Guillardia theta CCMP2712]|eukprot:XP_005819042.1 hypothetical protein GUITHDRAFT_148875 [Guillardia theta CCMP2712]
MAETKRRREDELGAREEEESGSAQRGHSKTTTKRKSKGQQSAGKPPALGNRMDWYNKALECIHAADTGELEGISARIEDLQRALKLRMENHSSHLLDQDEMPLEDVIDIDGTDEVSLLSQSGNVETEGGDIAITLVESNQEQFSNPDYNQTIRSVTASFEIGSGKMPFSIEFNVLYSEGVEIPSINALFFNLNTAEFESIFGLQDGECSKPSEEQLDVLFASSGIEPLRSRSKRAGGVDATSLPAKMFLFADIFDKLVSLVSTAEGPIDDVGISLGVASGDIYEWLELGGQR